MINQVHHQAKLLLGKLSFNEAIPEEYVAWAKLAVSNGFDTLSLESLAHGNRNSNERVFKLFRQTLKEINPKAFKNQLEIVQVYAFNIAKEYFSGKRTLQKTLSDFLVMYHETECHQAYAPFFYFCQDSKLLIDRTTIIKLSDKLKEKVAGVFKARLIEYLAENTEVDYRVELGKRSNVELVFIKFYDSKGYDFVALLVLDEILRKRSMTGDRLLRMKEQLNEVK